MTKFRIITPRTNSFRKRPGKNRANDCLTETLSYRAGDKKIGLCYNFPKVKESVIIDEFFFYGK